MRDGGGTARDNAGQRGMVRESARQRGTAWHHAGQRGTTILYVRLVLCGGSGVSCAGLTSEVLDCNRFACGSIVAVAVLTPTYCGLRTLPALRKVAALDWGARGVLALLRRVRLTRSRKLACIQLACTQIPRFRGR